MTFTTGLRVSGDGIRHLGDLVIAGVLMTITLPLMLIAALAVKLDTPGPVFARYARVGRGGRRMVVLQFRTTADQTQCLGNVCRDKRVTKVGRFLRYTRVDTLPQLANVLRGEMSFVGVVEDRPDFLR